MGEYDFLRFPAEAVQIDPHQFARLPESAQRVFEAVRDHGPLTHVGLREHTGIPARTVRFAVKRLKDAGFVDTRCSLQDCRTCYFFVARECVRQEYLEAAREAADLAVARGEKVVEHV